jgi:hypothetical protein
MVRRGSRVRHLLRTPELVRKPVVLVHWGPAGPCEGRYRRFIDKGDSMTLAPFADPCTFRQ